MLVAFDRARRPLQVTLLTLAVLAAGVATYRYISTRGTTNPLRAAEPSFTVEPAAGPVGMHPFFEVDGFTRGTLVKVALCAPPPATACAELASLTSPGRVRSAAIPATLPDPAGPRPVEPRDDYEMRATATGARTLTKSFTVERFAIGPAPRSRPYAGVASSTLRLGAPTEVARGAPCTSRFLPDDRVLVGKSVLDPRTAVAVDLTIPGAELAWSPRRDRLALVTEDRKEIRMAQPDASGQEVVAREARGLISSISWAPDGDRLAFVAKPQPGVRGGPPRPTAYSLDLTTGARTVVAPAEAVVWSPRPDRLALEVAEAGGRAIHVVDPAGKGSRLSDGRSPAWSPDGAMIAFVRGGDVGSVAVSTADAPSIAQVAESGVCGVSISPSGERMLLVTRTGGVTQAVLRPISVAR